MDYIRDVIWILFFTLAYISFIMLVRRLARLPASREFLGVYLCLFAMGFELSLFFNWFKGGKFFPRPKIFLSVLEICQKYILKNDYEAKVFFVIAAVTVLCFLYATILHSNLENPSFRGNKDVREIDRLKTRCFRIGTVLFTILFYIFWDVTY